MIPFDQGLPAETETLFLPAEFATGFPTSRDHTSTSAGFRRGFLD
jgi:hypothetical protein